MCGSESSLTGSIHGEDLDCRDKMSFRFYVF